MKKELGSLNNLQVDLKGNSAVHPKFAAGLDELVVHSDNLTDLFTRPATEACILHAPAVSAAGLEKPPLMSTLTSGCKMLLMRSPLSV